MRGMRELTEEELKLAPSWTTHYIVDSHDDVIYESTDLCWWEGLETPIDNYTFDEMRNAPITRKPFDISEHEFGDDIEFDELLDEEITLAVSYEQWGGHINGYSTEYKLISISKEDTIAIAKVLGVTGEDLK